jgi:pentatricopeptide repeat protein
MAWKFFHELKSQGWKPDDVWYTSMLWVLCKAGKLSEAEELFGQMETERVVPCAYAYNTMLMALATGGYAAMQSERQWNLDFTEHNEQGDRYLELAHRVAGVGLVGIGFGTGLELIGSGIVVGAGMVTSHLSPINNGEGNVSGFLWDPGGHAKNSLGTSCISRSGECQVC